MKLFNSSKKLFKADHEIITVKLKVNFRLNVLLWIHPIIFITEILHLLGGISVASTASS